MNSPTQEEAIMKTATQLLIIDPQNDFCDVPAG